MSAASAVRVEQATYDLMMQHLESGYPNEAAGFLLGTRQDGLTQIKAALTVENRWDPDTQATRYQLEARDWMHADDEAQKQSLAVVGIFHSHPEHPPHPSHFDLEMALPNLAYLITSVRGGKVDETLAWQMKEDRSGFASQMLKIV
jgi:proteasome lid subunit RPN8/RPN11